MGKYEIHYRAIVSFSLLIIIIVFNGLNIYILTSSDNLYLNHFLIKYNVFIKWPTEWEGFIEHFR